VPASGPQIVEFRAITNFDGCVFCCDLSCQRTPTPTPQRDAQNRQIFFTRSGQFVIVIEGEKGVNGLAPGMSLMPQPPDNRPDLQIESSRSLGNGSAAVCDTGPPSAGGGGVPGINPATFAAGNQTVTDVLNDFACRFDPSVSAAAPCTIVDATREPRLINSGADVQFCDFIAATAIFPPGETVLTARLRDVSGNVGPTAQIVVRVATPTPTP
jgi:hypothetical protein